MQWIELNNMEYGECIVLGGRNREILMVDCGSMNQKLREDESSLLEHFEMLADRYETAMDRYFLLTHYHRDHLNGFKKLLEAREQYFSRVFIPSTPLTTHGRPLLLEFALFAYIFLLPQTDCSQVNTSCVKIFSILQEKLGPDRIFTLGKGDRFRFDEVDYEVLWPSIQGFPYEDEIYEATEELNICLSSPFLPREEKRFMQLKDDFLALYVKCCGLFSLSGRALPEKRRSTLQLLTECLQELEELRETLNASPAAHDIRDILQRPHYAAAYSNCINSASVVFHNVRTKEAGFEDVLMTGDVTPEVLEMLSDHLYDAYYVLKAPHHGTASGYCRLFKDMGAAHILISNGEYHAGGAIAQEYIDMQEAVRHCTNCSPCAWYKASQACCNRLCYCHDQSNGSGLVIKCREKALCQGKSPGCGIRIVGSQGEAGCICERTSAL